MTNLRRLPALIGLASAVAAIATPVPGPDLSLVRPEVYHIRVGADSIWFCAETHPQPALTGYVFARATRRWSRARRLPATCAANHPPDTIVRISPRITASLVSAGASSFIRVRDAARNRRVDLKTAVPKDRVGPILKEGYEFEADTISTSISASAVNDSLIYLGLGGGFSEGQGAIGGIYRIHRRTGRFELITDSVVGEHTITSLASVGRWLWAATINPAEYGAYGEAGLLRMDQRTRAWRSYTDGNSPLPDALVRAMASDGRVLALATEKGLAVIELARPPVGRRRAANADESIARWNVGWFVHAFVGDSLVFNLGDSSAGRRTDRLDMSLTVAQASATAGRERRVFDAISGIDPDTARTHGVFDVERIPVTDSTRALIHERMLASRVEGSRRLAAMAIEAIGPDVPPSTRAVLRAAFLRVDSLAGDSRPTLHLRFLGRALIALGDSTPVSWARSVLSGDPRNPLLPPTLSAIHAWRSIELAPDLVRLYAVTPPADSGIVRQSTAALISLTGRADAPVYPGTAGEAAAWWDAWLRSTPAPKAVSPDSGQRALEAWLRRRAGR